MNKRPILVGFFSSAMKLFYYSILTAWLAICAIGTGCTSGSQSSQKDTDLINQFNKAGDRQGPWEIYSDSVLIARGSYANGKQEGLWTYFYKNGQMKEEGHYKQGIKDGMWVEWYSDGEIMWKGEWKEGTRTIEQKEATPSVIFAGEQPTHHVLVSDSVYDLQIRIPNIPLNHLFVEVNSGTISRVGLSDHFLLHTASDSMLTLAIGYIPDLQFQDFRNLVSEIQFKIR
jgi:antitoxin component YwqK of YwqJK toxin-antitoxin module